MVVEVFYATEAVGAAATAISWVSAAGAGAGTSAVVPLEITGAVPLTSVLGQSLLIWPGSLHL